jgi:hypothetical protein
MSRHPYTHRTGPFRIKLKGQAIPSHEVPALVETARDAAENDYVGRLTTWMLGALLIGVLVGAILYIFAVSPYMLRALSPMLEIL